MAFRPPIAGTSPTFTDVIITGNLEVQGNFTFNSVSANSFFLGDDDILSFGNTSASPDVRMFWNTAQTVDALYLGLSDAQNTFVIAENGDRAFDFAHGAQTNPTLFIHSAAQATDQWLSFAHNQTNAVIQTGLGDLILTIAGGNLIPSANDAWALGVSGTAVSDIFLASGAVINFDAGDVTITHSANALAFAGASTGYTFDALTTFTSNDHPIKAVNNLDNASVLAASFEGDRATMADNDEAFISLRLSNDAGTQTEFARITWVGTDVNAGTSVDGRLDFAVATAGTVADEMQLDGTALAPSTNDGLALGVVTTNAWSDLYLASGGIVNFDGGDVTITHSSNLLTMAGGNLTLTDAVTTMNKAAAGIALDINVTATTYTTAVGVIDLVRSGALTGVDTETIIDLNISPAFTLTEPGAGSVSLYGGMIDMSAVSVTAGAGTSVISALYLKANADADAGANYALLTSGALAPITNDVSALGTSALGFSDLFLATGAVINLGAGDMTLTHSANTLTITGGNFVFDDDVETQFGAGTDVRLLWETADADAHYFNIAVTGVSRNIIISEDTAIDWTHAASTNPTLWIQSADSATVADYISFSHDQTNAQVAVGAGDLILTIAGGNLLPSADDAWAIGASGQAVSDLFLADGSVINWSASDITLTHSTDVLSLSGGVFSHTTVQRASTTDGPWANSVEYGMRTKISATATTASTILTALMAYNAYSDTTAPASLQVYAITATTNLTNTVTGTIAEMGGIIIYNSVEASTTVTDHFGIKIQNASNAGTITNNYGIYVEAQTSGGTADYGVYIGGGDTYALWVDTGTSAFGGNLIPDTNDGAALGVTATGEWSDLFLASGAVINWASSDCTLTHASNTLTGAGAAWNWTASVAASSADGPFATNVAYSIKARGDVASATDNLYYAGLFAVNTFGDTAPTGNQAYAIIATGVFDAGSGTLTELGGILIGNENTTGGTVTNNYSLRIMSPTAGGTITNNYGIYIEAQTTGGTLNYGIYSLGGLNQFVGITIIGGTGTNEYSHLRSIQETAPTSTLTSTTLNDGAGSGAAITVTTGSTDMAGSFSVTAGNGTPTAGIAGQIVFDTAYAAAPKSVVVTSKDVDGINNQIYITAVGTTSFTINFGTALAASEVVEFYYTVIE